MRLKHIYFFSNFNINGISTRYRGVYVLKELAQKHGISNTFIHPGYRPFEIVNFISCYLKVLLTRRKGSVVIYQKLYTKGIYTNLLKLLVRIRPKGTVYDTDDADYLRYYDKNIYYFMRKCQICTVGSKALKEFAEEYNDNVLLLTSPVIRHTEIKENRNEILHIGWVGDYGLNKEYTFPFSHKVSLNKILFPILKELDFVFKLTILGIKNPTDKIEIETYFKNSNNILLDISENINWLNETSIYKKISEFDLGVSPMINHEFNIAKSAFKAKQYLSCGVPVLASPIGENMSFVKDGVNGFICKDDMDFKNRIIQINEMTKNEYDKLRRKTVLSVEDFSMNKYCNNLIFGLTKNNDLFLPKRKA